VAVALVSVPHVLAEHPAPLSDQVTPRFCESFCTVAVRVMAWETCTDGFCGATETLIAGAGAVRVMEVEADLVLSAAEVAFKLTFGGVVMLAGAM
jgi:hypothetical protein